MTRVLAWVMDGTEKLPLNITAGGPASQWPGMPVGSTLFQKGGPNRQPYHVFDRRPAAARFRIILSMHD